jgi:Asp-tRNA(Asn)/Glu-tRNA(Gln) amidotransferase A subunit family amidase
VADLELLLDAMADEPIEKCELKRPARIGVLRDFFFANATDEMRDAVNHCADTLDRAGFRVSEAKPPAIFDFGPATLRTILRAEMAAAHESLFRSNPEAYRPKIRAVVETGLLVDAASYLRALRIRQIYRREIVRLFESYDVLLSPGARGTAPEGLSGTGDSVMQLPWALADLPTLSLPAGRGANGLPLGIQLTAAPFEEGLLLEIGKNAEKLLAVH